MQQVLGENLILGLFPWVNYLIPGGTEYHPTSSSENDTDSKVSIFGRGCMKLFPECFWRPENSLTSKNAPDAGYIWPRSSASITI